MPNALLLALFTPLALAASIEPKPLLPPGLWIDLTFPFDETTRDEQHRGLAAR